MYLKMLYSVQHVPDVNVFTSCHIESSSSRSINDCSFAVTVEDDDHDLDLNAYILMPQLQYSNIQYCKYVQ